MTAAEVVVEDVEMKEEKVGTHTKLFKINSNLPAFF